MLSNLNSNEPLRLSDHAHLVQTSNGALLYHSLNGNICSVNKDTIAIIEQFRNGATQKSVQETYEVTNAKEFFGELVRLRFLVPVASNEYDSIIEASHQLASRASGGALVRNLRLMVTNACNFTCDYCMNVPIWGIRKDGMMSLSTAMKAVDQFIQNAQAHGLNDLSIRFFGGEPLLNWTVVRNVMERTLGHTSPCNVSYIINTNGSLMTAEIAEFCSKMPVFIILSLDGTQPVNDAVRHYRNGQGTFDGILRALSILQGKGIRLAVSTTVTDGNRDSLIDLIDLLKDLHVKEVGLSPALFSLKRGVGEESARKIFQAYTHGREIGVKVGGTWRWIVSRFEKPASAYCAGIGSEVSAMPNGDLFPCSGIGIKVGRVEDLVAALSSPEFSRIASRRLGSISKCRGCFIEGMCLGGCAGNALFDQGDMNYPATEECHFFQTIARLMLEELTVPRRFSAPHT